ncbi:MAG TPA: acyl carrier protein [Acholeplasmataceae bacterium]|jgi:acyl carrier protein|nr:acyl carrier protein [Acholeplasmataceae bacterium]
MFEKVANIIANELNVDEKKITLETDLQNDLGADSLDAVELIMAIEEEFNITIPDEKAQNIRTVKDIVSLLETL